MLKTGPKSLLVNGSVPWLARARFGGGAAPAAESLNCPLLPSHPMLNPLAGVITTGVGGGGGVMDVLISISSISVNPLATLMRMPVAEMGLPVAERSNRCRRYGVKKGKTAD